MVEAVKCPVNPLDYVAVIMDEVALEGLDGITPEALKTRLSVRKPPFLGASPWNPALESFMWNVLIRNVSDGDLKAYLLSQERGELEIFDRYRFVDPDLGIMIEPDLVPDEIYSFKLVDGEEKGSCVEYETRVDISNEISSLSYSESITKYGSDRSFVFVASQRCRGRAILGPGYDYATYPITGMQWAILERVGRARFLGEVSQGKLSLQFMKENPKTLFYHRKALIKLNLLTKQIHHQKSKGQNFQGTLFHLPRFYTERRSKALTIVYNIVKLLKARPNGMASCEEVREYLNLGHSVKKIFKTQEFMRFMKGSSIVPYRTLHPLASDAEWRCKSSASKEKTVRVIQLIDMNVDPEIIWQERKEEDEPDDEGNGFLDQSRLLVDRSLMSQAYALLEEVGPEGIYQCDLGQKLGLGKLEARTICRNLERRNLVKTLMKDVGRQRATYFVAKKFSHLSAASNQLQSEKKKMESLYQSTKPLPASPSVNKDCLISSPPRTSPCPLVSSTPIQCGIAQSGNLFEMEITQTDLGNDPVSMIQSNSFSETSNRKGIKPSDNSSFRQLSRANAIIESVRQHKVIDDTTKLYKMILLKEEAEGISTRMDKKSLMRILDKLAIEGQIRNIRVTLKNETKQRILHFVCDPEISESHTVIQSAIEQAKMKFNITPKNREESLFKSHISESVGQSMDEISNLLTDEESKMIYNPRIGKKYGLQPKFVRMREFHIFLFYLTYGYNGESVKNKDDLYEEWAQKGMHVIDDACKKELEDIPIFTRDISWRMFISKLPHHRGWESGWCLMCDVLLRLPLSYFVKLVNITYVIPGIEAYLSHPIKQHYLIRFLPQDMRNKLLFHRKYIFTCYEVATRLAYIGALQFGPQKLKEKDQFFVYVNRKTTLLDTTNSSPGYHQVEEDKEYPERHFEFNSMDDVEQFWYQMWEICVYTPLGASANFMGQEITVENMDKKEALMNCLNPKSCNEAILNDIGTLPGDRRGAAGLDSSMFSHLKRNWSWTNRDVSRNSDVLKHLKTSSAKLSSKMSKKEPVKVTLEPNMKRTTRGQKRKRESSSNRRKTSTDDSTKTKTQSPKSNIRTRVIMKRTNKEERKPYYDEVDKSALRLMRKLRVDWTSAEDSLLLLCKVAGSYLCQNTRYQMVQYTSVRDLLHKRFPESLNKTSRACQRRLNYMIKNPTTADNVSLFLSDVKQDPLVREKFPLPEDGEASKKDEEEKRIKRDFEPLVAMLVSKYQNNNVERASTNSNISSQKLDLPDTIEEIKVQYSFVYPECTLKERFGFQDPENIEDIKASVINALITSSLCSASDKNSWAFQLFKIYQQYPDRLLRDTMTKLRKNRMVSLKKSYNRSKVKMGNYLPLSSSPYQLSVTFSHLFLCRYQHDIYNQSWEFFKHLILKSKNDPSYCTEVIVGHEGGYAASIVSALALKNLNFKVEVPEQLVVLDPNLSRVDDAYVRILQRYKELIRSAGDKTFESEILLQDGKNLTVSSLFKENKLLDKSSTAKRALSDPLIDEPSSKKKKFSDNDIVFQEGEPVGGPSSEGRSTQQVARSASRIALHIMREELKDSASSSFQKQMSKAATIQHSHDFFVISSCRIFVNFPQEYPTKGEIIKCLNSETGNYEDIPKELLPGVSDAAERILNRHGLDIYGKFNQRVEKLRRTCIPQNIGRQSLPVIDGISEKFVTEVYQNIKSSKECGISGPDLTKSFVNEKSSVEKVVSSLVSSYFVIRAGTVKTKYIATAYASSWLLHSFKMSRTKDKESAPNIKFADKYLKLPNEERSAEAEDKPSSSSAYKEQVSEAAKRIDWSKVEQIQVILRPWIKVDGNLNRRVLDRLMGAILGYIMQKPGLFLTSIQEKFSPALQPHHTRELVEMLQELEAVKISKLNQPSNSRCSLFSTLVLPQVEESSFLDDCEDLIVEPLVDAIVKLGQFIRDKLYSYDFICHCPCHPDKK